MSFAPEVSQALTAICEKVNILDGERVKFDEVEQAYSSESSAAGPEAKKLSNFPAMPRLPALPARAERHAPALNSVLSNMLYHQCYTGHFPLEVAEQQSVAECPDLTALFTAANDNKDGWDPGWRIYQVQTNGRLFVQKGDRTRAVIAGEYSTYKWPGVMPKIGDMLSVRMFAGSTDVQPSFFYAFGRTLSDQFDECAIVRFYFNIRVDHAVRLMAAVTQTLNRYLIPFRFKSLVSASAYTRADNAVLYVAKRYYHIVASLMTDLQLQLGDGLRPGAPLFCKPLLPGIALAEDPAPGVSFGMHRCGLIAAGIADAWASGSQEVAVRMAAIEQQFLTQGIRLEAPYLNPSSFNLFEQTIFSLPSLSPVKIAC